MKSWLPLFLLLILILSCQIIPTPPPLKSTQPVRTTLRVVTPWDLNSSETADSLDAIRSKTASPLSHTASIPTANLPPGELSSFPYSPKKPFSEIGEINWSDGPIANTADILLPVSLRQIDNREVIAGLTSRQRSFLENYGFIVLHSREEQFLDIHERVSLLYGQPYFLTTDVAFHALDLTLSEVLSALEKEELLPRMTSMTQATLSMIDSYLPLVKGTSLESDTLLAAAYLGVALKLFDPQVKLWPYLEEQVASQIAQIHAGRGVEVSTLIPNLLDDYAAYRPKGHYVGDPSLEGYYRGMTWLSRTHYDFQGNNPISSSLTTGEYPNGTPSRVPQLVTLALRQALTAKGPAAQEWGKIQEALDFLVGPNLDTGPAEYADLMDQIYGRGMTVIDLYDEARWQSFQTLIPVIPSPKINSVFLKPLEDLEIGHGWRFVGRRFNLDDLIFKNLISDRVGTVDDMRETASGLDVMAAFGSSAALQVLKNSGDTTFKGYFAQMDGMQSAIRAQSEAGWNGTIFNSWMYALLPKLSDRDEKYPSYMRTSAWSFKDLNSSLGGWVDTKHDTVTYSYIPETNYDVKMPDYGGAPGYVEPDPIVFYRMAHLAATVSEGLNQRGFVGVFSTDSERLGNLLLDLLDLGDRLQRLGDIAAKELSGVPLEMTDFNLIHAPLGPAEERALRDRASRPRYLEGRWNLPSMEGVVAVEGSGERILQLGLGAVDRIYVIIPLDGKLQIAQGGVYSYYEFLQPRSYPLTDKEWQQQLVSPIDRPAWVELFSLPDGNPVDVLAFRIGDKYRITTSGGMLNLHESPSRISLVLRKLQPGERLIIVDGPVLAEGMTWWKFRIDNAEANQIQGWAVENQEWYERASEQ